MKTRAALLGCLGVHGVYGAGCGPEPVAQAELGEVCGAPSPFRVLALEPDEQLRIELPLTVGDRVLYVASKLGVDEPGAAYPSVAGTTVWATGPCGEDPVRVASGVTRLFTREEWPDLALGCDSATHDVVLLDPSGVREPQVVFPGSEATFACGLRFTPHGMLTVEEHDEDFGALVLYGYPADPWTEAPVRTVLLDPVRISDDSGRAGLGYIGLILKTFDDFVLAVTPEDTLVRIDLPGGVVTPLQSGVTAFDTSRQGRYVVWQSTEGSGDEPEAGESALSLRDLTAGTDEFLVDSALRYSFQPMRWADEGVVQVGLGRNSPGPTRIFFLPGLESVDSPEEVLLTTRLDDGRWIASRWVDGLYNVVDLKQGTATPLYPRPTQISYLDDESAELIEMPPCCVDGDYRQEGPLWRATFDGAAPTQLAARATRGRVRLADGRYLTPVDIDAKWRGPLLLLDPEAGTELAVDESVFALSLDASRFADEGIVRYSVADGERSGVYLAKLPQPSNASTRSRRSPVEALVFDVMPGADGRPVPHARRLDEPPRWSGSTK